MIIGQVWCGIESVLELLAELLFQLDSEATGLWGLFTTSTMIMFT